MPPIFILLLTGGFIFSNRCPYVYGQTTLTTLDDEMTKTIEDLHARLTDADLSSSFEKDNIMIGVLTIVFVILVLVFTFKSSGLPVLLILVIQGSVWINFTLKAHLPIQSHTGVMRLDGHVRGYVSGMVDADFTGLLRGTINAAGSNVGLFRYLQEGAVVQDLYVYGSVRPFGSAVNVSGTVGSNAGAVRNCTFSGAVEGKSAVGGVAGLNQETGELARTITDGSVTGGEFTGGAAGRNLGALLQCENGASVNTATPAENTGTVGYPHVGYNVGGLSGQLGDALDQLADAASLAAPVGRGLERAFRILRTVAGNLAEDGSTQFTPLGEASREAGRGLFDALTNLSGELKDLHTAVDQAGDQLSADLRAISRQFNTVFQVLLNVLSDIQGGVDGREPVEDTSDENIAATRYGKVENCRNEGTVDGDRNVGGVAGLAGGMVRESFAKCALSGAGAGGLLRRVTNV